MFFPHLQQSSVFKGGNLEAHYVRQNTNLNILDMRKPLGIIHIVIGKWVFVFGFFFSLKCQLKKREIGQEKDTRIQIETFLPWLECIFEPHWRCRLLQLSHHYSGQWQSQLVVHKPYSSHRGSCSTKCVLVTDLLGENGSSLVFAYYVDALNRICYIMRFYYPNNKK